MMVRDTDYKTTDLNVLAIEQELDLDPAAEGRARRSTHERVADRRGHRSDTGHDDYSLGLEDVDLEADREEVDLEVDPEGMDLEADPDGANFGGRSQLEIDCVEYVQIDIGHDDGRALC